ncbi:HD domain-containing protein, partial [Klebsiella pneumoniae]|uniref:HD domain-containing protein n=1 Tax=Klebsiella pneumoniae TaxID=573 RepID=UPI00396816CC
MAASYAIAAHTAVGQLRDGSGKPYWHHLLQVAEMAQLFDLSHAAYKAARLHDVNEDTAVTASGQPKRSSIHAV